MKCVGQLRKGLLRVEVVSCALEVCAQDGDKWGQPAWVGVVWWQVHRAR